MPNSLPLPDREVGHRDRELEQSDSFSLIDPEHVVREKVSGWLGFV
jgi:hypothetical protein